MRFVKGVGILIACSMALAQGRQEPGRSIGSAATQDELIVMTLDKDVLGKVNLFDLVRHTLRFTPDGTGFRAENLPFAWDAEFGDELNGSAVSLHNFAFPFSGKNWDSLSVGAYDLTVEAMEGMRVGRLKLTRKSEPVVRTRSE